MTGLTTIDLARSGRKLAAGAVILSVLLGQTALAQTFLFGVKGGVPLSSYFTGNASGGPAEVGTFQYSDVTQRYVAGLSAEWRGPHGFGLEVDGLYRRAHYLFTFSNFDNGAYTDSSSDTKVSSLDFPILAKYRLPFLSRMQPFVSGGAVLRHLYPGHQVGQTTVTDTIPRTPVVTTFPINNPNPLEVQKRTYSGVAFGVGLEKRIGPVHLLPEFRFTDWISNIPDLDSQGFAGLLHLTSPQADFLLGIMF